MFSPLIRGPGAQKLAIRRRQGHYWRKRKGAVKGDKAKNKYGRQWLGK
jgi:hypothetical protein